MRKWLGWIVAFVLLAGGTGAASVTYWNGLHVTSGILESAPCAPNACAGIGGLTDSIFSNSGIETRSYGMGFNGTTWDRQRDTNAFGGSQLGISATDLVDPNNGYPARINNTGDIEVQTGGQAVPTKLTATTCTSIAGSGVVHKLWAAGTETATVSIYDESSATCSAANLVWTGTLSSTPVTLDYAVGNGLTYKMSAAPAVNDYVTRN